MNTFTAPAAGGEGFSAADCNGHLLIVDVLGYEPSIPTSLGDKDAIRATVHDVDTGTVYEDTLIFPKLLVSSLKARAGQKVLARLGQGVAKPGQSAPWVLNDETNNAQSVSAAEAHLSKYTADAYSAPEPVAAATPAPAASSQDDAAVEAAKALLAQQGMLQ